VSIDDGKTWIHVADALGGKPPQRESPPVVPEPTAVSTALRGVADGFRNLPGPKLAAAIQGEAAAIREEMQRMTDDADSLLGVFSRHIHGATVAGMGEPGSTKRDACLAALSRLQVQADRSPALQPRLRDAQQQFDERMRKSRTQFLWLVVGIPVGLVIVAALAIGIPLYIRAQSTDASHQGLEQPHQDSR
jgi:hypothetical protein